LDKKEVFKMNSVKLIGVTQPTLFVEGEGGDCSARKFMTAEQLIAYCARVSNPANQDNPDSERLLKYLVKNKHWSPFEMVHVIMEIVTTRDIGRQILRHRSFSFQEFSQRYAAVAEMSEPREARLQDQKNRQNSIEMNDALLEEEWYNRQKACKEWAQHEYMWAIKNGIAKEQARVVLPEGLTMSRMYMSGSLRSWIHYCELRMGNGTQKEHREIATQCWNIITEQFPSLKNVLNND
jgi:thymidylate synthase (FAD)